jgi:homoserine dehydrogenase
MALGVGVIGAGTVGGGVINILLSNRDVITEKSGLEISLKHVAELHQDCLKEFDLSGVTVSSDADALILDPEVDVVCELIGGLEPAKRFVLKALENKKHVVTANKMLLAYHGRELCEVATRNGVDLRYEAAVAGGIPIIKALREGLAANRVQGIYAILNGTCNYILTRMTYEGLEFDDALQRAIASGFAETPPDLDIEGHDTAHKCQILASLAFSSPVGLEDIHVEGVTKVTHADVAYAREMGYIIKLLGIIRKVDDSMEVRVHPTLVPEDHLLASVRREFNAIYVQSDMVGDTLYYGRGAGRLPTASAVVADLVDIARRGEAPARPPFVYACECPGRSIGEVEARYYIRLLTADRPGVLGRICTIVGDHGVSIASCIQKEVFHEGRVPVVLMTHETLEAPLRDAVNMIDQEDFVYEPAHVLRVL